MDKNKDHIITPREITSIVKTHKKQYFIENPNKAPETQKPSIDLAEKSLNKDLVVFGASNA